MRTSDLHEVVHDYETTESLLGFSSLGRVQRKWRRKARNWNGKERERYKERNANAAESISRASAIYLAGQRGGEEDSDESEGKETLRRAVCASAIRKKMDYIIATK